MSPPLVPSVQPRSRGASDVTAAPVRNRAPSLAASARGSVSRPSRNESRPRGCGGAEGFVRRAARIPRDQAAVVALGPVERRKGSRDGDPPRVAGKDAGDEWFDQSVGDLGPEAARGEVPDALSLDGLGATKRLAEQSELGAEGEKRGPDQLARRHGYCVQSALEVDVSPGAGVGAENLIGEAELLDQGPELARGPDGVRAELEQEAFRALRAHDAARSGGALEEEDVAARFRQRPGRREAGETRADDDGRTAHAAQKGSTERASSARARRNVGRSFRPGVRRKCAIPASRACPAKS